MSILMHLIEQYGLIAVFLNVLVEQGGAPIPAYPTLVITGALANRGEYSPFMLLGVAVAAALIADFGWYWAGRRYGRKVLSTLCRISLSPDSCVRQTELIFSRWGALSLLFAKFIPGFASVASALAGTTGTSRAGFILFDGLGAALWAGSAIYIGSLFSTTIDDLLGVLEQLGKGGMLLLLAALIIFIASKWWQRYLFLKSLRMARISVNELYDMLQNGERPTIVDVRTPASQQEGRIPGAVTISDDLVQTFVADVPTNREVIVYCACPNEASAARIAMLLMKQGYHRVRPLHGGIDAWVEAGYVLEGSPPSSPPQ
jgi:membrane protein DedA with SNARE-associated domain/rhodanese-related sulfurtransferase